MNHAETDTFCRQPADRIQAIALQERIVRAAVAVDDDGGGSVEGAVVIQVPAVPLEGGPAAAVHR